MADNIDQDLAHWRECLRRDYGINGVLSRLDGEFDLNFAVHCDGDMAFVLKVMRPACAVEFVEMQIDALQRIAKSNPGLPVPRVVPGDAERTVQVWQSVAGDDHLAWVITALPGLPLGDMRPHTTSLMFEIGKNLGAVANTLSEFEHPQLDRDFKWHPLHPLWIEGHLNVIEDAALKSQINEIIHIFKSKTESVLLNKKQQAIQCDANDYNLLVAPQANGPKLSGIIDFGDMTRAPAVCDLATAAAYLVLDQERPFDILCALVAGYHETHPLDDDDLSVLFPLLLTRLAVSVVNSALMKQERPDDAYVVVSEAPALAFLGAARQWSAAMIHQRLRVALGFNIVSHAGRITDWINNQSGQFFPMFGMDLGTASVCSCAVGDVPLPVDPTALGEDEAARLVPEALASNEPFVGHYLEPRLVYTEPAFLTAEHPVDGRRTMHLGIDVFLPAGQPVFAPVDSIVVTAVDRARRLDYGGVVILAHQTDDGDDFYTLYGHLDPASIAELKPGQSIGKGEAFACLGAVAVNGNWQPHLHFQLSYVLSQFGDERDHDWPGVADADDLVFQSALYPNPASLLGLDPIKMLYPIADTEAGITARKARFGGNLKLSYRRPLQLLRGWKHYLYDEYGRTHLDAYNNVPHVGHAHPRLQAIAARQLSLINTNTRYLHPAQMKFADALRQRLPDHLTHCYFLTSGSEANELALRLARAHTGGKAMIVQDHAYHGHTTGTIDISPYKFNGPGGAGAPDWVEIVQVADPYRGPFGYSDAMAGEKYAADIDNAVARIAAKGGRLAGFIAESFPSVGGQIEPPQGYLASVYDRVRAAGGLCIADEVQTGLGRLGDAFWGFETQKASPDIVVLGKPIGNGHPIGAVVTSEAIAASFTNGMEFFSTFGGTTLACLIGSEVLQIIDDEGLQHNAAARGDQLLTGFRALQKTCPLIGDVRGRGLFLGIELVTDPDTKIPATALAGYVANQLRDHRILIGTDGPHDNVLKIRPPLTIGEDDCALLLYRMEQVLAEACYLDI